MSARWVGRFRRARTEPFGESSFVDLLAPRVQAASSGQAVISAIRTSHAALFTAANSVSAAFISGRSATAPATSASWSAVTPLASAA